MACPGPECTAASVYLNAPTGNLTKAQGETFLVSACFTITPIGGPFLECADCAATLVLEFKKTTDPSWTTMTSGTALSTTDANPQMGFASFCDQCDVDVTWTVTCNAASVGFSWLVRVSDIASSTCMSDTPQITVIVPAGASPMQLLAGGA